MMVDTKSWRFSCNWFNATVKGIYYAHPGMPLLERRSLLDLIAMYYTSMYYTYIHDVCVYYNTGTTYYTACCIYVYVEDM